MQNLLSFCQWIVLFCIPLAKIQAGFLYAPGAPGGISSIAIVDTSTNMVVDSIPLVGFSQGDDIVFSPDGSLGYVTASLGGNQQQVLVLDTATNIFVATIDVGMAVNSLLFGSAITPNGQFVYIVNSGSDNISVIDTTLNSVIATINVGSTPFGIVATPNGRFVYVVNTDDATLSLIDTGTNSVTATIVLSGALQQIAITPDGALAYITNSDPSGGVNILDTTTNTLVATISDDNDPNGIVISPSGTLVYATNLNPDAVIVIKKASDTIIATIPISASSASAAYMAIAPSGFVYVSQQEIGITPINAITNTAGSPIPGTDHVYGMALLPPPPTPSSIAPQGSQVSNQFLSQTNLANVLTWAPPINFIPTSYQIFRDAALTNLAGTVSKNDFSFVDNNRVKNQVYTYFIVAVNAVGLQLNLGSVTISPH